MSKATKRRTRRVLVAAVVDFFLGQTSSQNNERPCA